MSAASSRIRIGVTRPGFSLNVDLEIPATGITVLFGASGSGKTTVLRCVAGLERACQGLVRIGEHVWQDDAARTFLATWRRPLGYVFQEASLFEHLTVSENMRYGLKRAGSPDAGQALDAAIRLLGVEDLQRRMPAQLSGGERQRVAIARALATQPRLLLLDEPLASLDHARKQEILPWLERLRDELRTPMLYVTHSADELARLADHLVVLDRGRVKAQGPPVAALASIDNPLLTGDDVGALLAGQVAERDTRWHLVRVTFAGGSLWLRDSGLPIGHAVRLRVLARDVSIASDEPHGTSIQNHLPCTIESSTPDTHPSQMLVRVSVGGAILLARITGRSYDALDLRPGKRVWLQVKSVALLQ
ncbi:MAG TPA: molybdenum ABC transporter ATP-binding protein [Burkholderiaceae bacterium]|nr:molybdenum ABC transporter ATP-binding protein [Burkholderiaceae bacterium]